MNVVIVISAIIAAAICSSAFAICVERVKKDWALPAAVFSLAVFEPLWVIAVALLEL